MTLRLFFTISPALQCEGILKFIFPFHISNNRSCYPSWQALSASGTHRESQNTCSSRSLYREGNWGGIGFFPTSLYSNFHPTSTKLLMKRLKLKFYGKKKMFWLWPNAWHDQYQLWDQVTRFVRTKLEMLLLCFTYPGGWTQRLQPLKGAPWGRRWGGARSHGRQLSTEDSQHKAVFCGQFQALAITVALSHGYLKSCKCLPFTLSQTINNLRPSG